MNIGTRTLTHIGAAVLAAVLVSTGGAAIARPSAGPGATWGPVIDLALSQSQSRPGVVVDRAGNTTVVWRTLTAIIALRQNAAGVWGTPHRLGHGIAPKVGVDGAGTVTAIWTGSSPGSGCKRCGDRPPPAGRALVESGRRLRPGREPGLVGPRRVRGRPRGEPQRSGPGELAVGRGRLGRLARSGQVPPGRGHVARHRQPIPGRGPVAGVCHRQPRARHCLHAVRTGLRGAALHRRMESTQADRSARRATPGGDGRRR